MAKKKIDIETSKAPEQNTGAFILPGDTDPETIMKLQAIQACGLSMDDVQSIRVRGLDSHGNRMVIITTVDDRRIRYPIPQNTEDS